MNPATIGPNLYYSSILYHQHTYSENPYYSPYYHEHQSSSASLYHHIPYQTPITIIDFEQRDQMRMIIEQKLGLLFDPMDWCVHFDEVMELLLERYPELRDDLSSPSPLPPSTAPLVFDEMPEKAVETLWYQTPPSTTTTMLQTSPYTVTTIPPTPHDWQTSHKTNQSPLTINTMETRLQAPTESTPDFIDLITYKEEKRCCKESEVLQEEELEFGQAKTEIQYGFTTIDESSELENSIDQFNKDTHQCDMEKSNQNGSDFHVLAASKVSLPLTFQISAPILPPLSSESPPQCSLSILPSITTTRHSKPIEKAIKNTIIHHTHKLFDSTAEPTVSHHSKLIQVYCSDDPHHHCYPIISPHLRPPSQPPDTSLVCKPPQISKRPPIIRPPPPQCLHQPKFPNHARSVPLEFQKVEIALLHLDRDVVPWWYQTKFLGPIWQMFAENVLQHFGPRECVEFSIDHLKTKQGIIVNGYDTKFMRLACKIHECMDDPLMYFVGGDAGDFKMWRIIEVELQHNHPVSSEIKGFYKSHKKMILAAQKAQQKVPVTEIHTNKLYRTAAMDSGCKGYYTGKSFYFSQVASTERWLSTTSSYDLGMKHKLLRLGRKLKEIDEDVQRHNELLEVIRGAPSEISEVVARWREDFTKEFFVHLQTVAESYYDNPSKQNALAKLGNMCLVAVEAYNSASESMEALNAAELKFQDIINSPSLDAACRKIDSLAEKNQLDSALVLMMTNAWSAVKESNMMKDEVKDILYHLYKTARSNLQRLMPKEISSEGNVEIMRKTRVGIEEYKLEISFIHHVYMYSGYSQWSYMCIYVSVIVNSQAPSWSWWIVMKASLFEGLQGAMQLWCNQGSYFILCLRVQA